MAKIVACSADQRQTWMRKGNKNKKIKIKNKKNKN
jgi:hypothetical protein